MSQAEEDFAESSAVRAPPPEHRLYEEFGSDLNDASGITIEPAPHLANAIATPRNRWTAEGILNSLQPQDDTRAQLVQSSFQDGADVLFHPTANGLVDTAIHAYNLHRHLKIRPEDVWLAILTQLSSYINANAEQLRGSFVAHQGKKELEIWYNPGVTRFTLAWDDFAYKIGTIIQDNVVDPELRAWIMPAFSTTTSHDTVVASIVMMASMQKYFTYGVKLIRGLPSVTLLGQKADYELILRRINKLRSYGTEPTLFADLLTPILKRFVRSFDEPEGADVLEFWNRIFARWNMGSGEPYITGWITAFMFWDEEGKVLYSPQRSDWVDENLPPLTLDGTTYHTITEGSVPSGFCTVPVTIDEQGRITEAEMLAGGIGWDWSSSGEAVAHAGEGTLDTVQPRSGWWIYEKSSKEQIDLKRKAKREEEEARLTDFHRKHGIEH